MALRSRKNQKSLTTQEWDDFVDAIDQTHGVAAAPPAYRAFVKVHVKAMLSSGMSWGVHTMPMMGMRGRNFLAWHRLFLLRFEDRLRLVHPKIAIPYWDTLASPSIPARLKSTILLKKWSVDRAWDASRLPAPADLARANAQGTFTDFQSELELGLHGAVHNAVGGDMADRGSPTDPVFWLHHANIDRIWGKWQKKNPGENPPNQAEVLEPSPMFGQPVSNLLDIAKLSYRYA